MIEYQNLLRNIRNNGQWQMNRTGVWAQSIKGAMCEYDISSGFPAVTVKKLYWPAVVGELLGFIRGYTNAADFRALGCNVWDKDANENPEWVDNPFRDGEDDLGLIYGHQWRNWDDGCAGVVDQLRGMVKKLKKNPHDRRNIVSAWRPDELHMMALPPCHVMFQVGVEAEGLVLAMYQRSADAFLGVPFNVASYALLANILARLTGLRAHKLVHFMFDAHIYENHMPQVEIMLARKPLPAPLLEMHPSINRLDDLDHEGWVNPSHFKLIDYASYGPLPGELNVGQPAGLGELANG